MEGSPGSREWGTQPLRAQAQAQREAGQAPGEGVAKEPTADCARGCHPRHSQHPPELPRLTLGARPQLTRNGGCARQSAAVPCGARPRVSLT